VESNTRYFRRRAAEEYAAAQRAVTLAARERRIDLAKRFLEHLDEGEAREMLFDWGLATAKSRARDRVSKDRIPTHA
jgi:hypothetical protein